MKCPICGGAVPEQAVFCPACGARLAQPDDQTYYENDYAEDGYAPADGAYGYDDGYEYPPENGGRKSKGMIAALVAMGLVIVILLCVLLYILFGDKFKKSPSSPTVTTTTVQTTLPGQTTDPAAPATTATAAPGTTDANGNVPTATAAPAGVGSYRVNTQSDPLRIRMTPSTDGEQLGSIPKGTVVTVAEVQNGWGKVTYNGVTGWASMQYLAPVVS